MAKKSYTIENNPADIYRFIESVTYQYENNENRLFMEAVRQGARVCFGSSMTTGGKPLMEMACNREQLIGKLKHKTKDFITWWCLLRYLYKYGDPNNLVNHERGKWISLAIELCGLTLTDGNSERTKRKFLETYWKRGNSELPGEDYDTVPSKVISVIYPKFADEQITDIERMHDVAVEFGANVDELIRIISTNAYADVPKHADQWFPSTVEPQKPRRTKKNRRNVSKK